MFLKIALLVLSICFSISVGEIYPQVKTQYGIVQGRWKTTKAGTKFASFEGVPYAKPPIKELRFKEAEPIEPWIGIWQADSKYQCIQYKKSVRSHPDIGEVFGEEDCLYINIYTPDLSNKQRLNVVIYIHGGGFIFHSGNGGKPDFLLDRNLIYVTINYRLGPLGFLSTEDQVLPGNNGLKDQALALKWIKDNIKYFGGNPDTITITGLSAGGASVHMHTMSPISKGLFARAVPISGNALDCWVQAEDSLEKAKKLAVLQGCPSDNSTAIIDCLRTRSARQIVQSVKDFFFWRYNPYSPFGAVVDKWSANPFLPEHPYKLLKKRKIQDVPILFSVTNAEGLYPAAEFVHNDILTELETRWYELMPHILHYNETVDPQHRDVVSKKIKDFYFNGKPVSEETRTEMIKVHTDRLFIADSDVAVKLHVKAVTSPVYYYFFTYRGAHSASEDEAGDNGNYGVSHGDDFFSIVQYFDVTSTEEDKRIVNILLDIWESFAKNGTPNIKNIEWNTVEKGEGNNFNVLFIDSPSNIGMKTVDSLGHSEFWSSLGLKENSRLFN